jgi:hypothetical protein
MARKVVGELPFMAEVESSGLEALIQQCDIQQPLHFKPQ